MFFYPIVACVYLIAASMSGNSAAIFVIFVICVALLKAVIQLNKKWVFFDIPDINVSSCKKTKSCIMTIPVELNNMLLARKAFVNIRKKIYLYVVFSIQIYAIVVCYDIARKNEGGMLISWYFVILANVLQISIFIVHSIKSLLLYNAFPWRLVDKKLKHDKYLVEFLARYHRPKLRLDDKDSCMEFCSYWKSREDAMIALNIAINLQITIMFYPEDKIFLMLDMTRLSDYIFSSEALSYNPTFEEIVNQLKKYEWKRRYKKLSDIPKRIKLPVWCKSYKQETFPSGPNNRL